MRKCSTRQCIVHYCFDPWKVCAIMGCCFFVFLFFWIYFPKPKVNSYVFFCLFLLLFSVSVRLNPKNWHLFSRTAFKKKKKALKEPV